MEREAYYIRIGGETVEVSREVYEAYHSGKRRERTLEEKDRRHGLVRYDAWDNEDGTGTEALRGNLPSPEETAVTNILTQKLRGLLASLGAEDREMIYSLYFEEIPLAVFAREKGIPRKTLEYRRDRILSKLRKRMEEPH